ncbi:hypothetical protein BJV82DRAFT_576843 [Fennellomyces sp. T-0311]|nr:hypothetical protein BJV82DRAFT_576843 [Fennellomyces sp. T-0311]
MSDAPPPPPETTNEPPPPTSGPPPPTSDPQPDPTTSEPPPPTTSDEPPPTTTEEPPPTTTSQPDPDPTTTPDPAPTTTPEPTPSPDPTTTGGEQPTTTVTTSDEVPTVTTTTDNPEPTDDTPTTTSTPNPTPNPTTNPITTTASPTDEQPPDNETTTWRLSSTPIEVTSVVSSGTHVYTVTSTSFSIVPTSGEIGDGGTSSTNTGAIAGGVVGGVAFVGIIAGIFFFMLRRRRKQKKSPYGEDLDDPYANYPDMAAARPMSPGTSSGTPSSNARPLVAPLRPASKVADDDYGQYRDPATIGAYYEDTSPQQSARHSSPSTGVPYYPQGMHDDYSGNYPQQQQGYWPEGSSDGGDRHVPNLVDDHQPQNDVPHSRS